MLNARRNRFLILAVLVFSCSAAAENKNATDSNSDNNDFSGGAIYRSNVSEVRVTFFATDENNHPLDIIDKTDFAVVDNERVIRSFRSFTHSDETSLEVVALVDLSESVAPRVRVAINDVLQLVAREQSVPDDNVSVLSFGGAKPAVLCTSGCRAADSGSRLLAMKGSGTTPLYDGLIFAAEFIAHHRRPGVRPVLILFTDGIDTISLHTANDAMDALLGSGVFIYAVDFGTPASRSSKQMLSSAFLQELAQSTGGRYFFSPRASSSADASTVLNAVLDDLCSSWVVSYNLPSHEAGFHSLRLLPTHKLNVTFHSRNGYNYEPSGYR
jgi:VWFA-related protein